MSLPWYRFRKWTVSKSPRSVRSSLCTVSKLAFMTGLIYLFLNSLPPNPRPRNDPEMTFIDPDVNFIQLIKTKGAWVVDTGINCSNIEGWPQNSPQLVQCLKQSFLIPPSNTSGYKLNNPEISNPSQFKQNVFVHQLLGYKRNGVFIECGAFDGELLSNTLMLERDFGWTGLLIEPQPIAYRLLELRNRNAWISNACLSIKPFAQKLQIVGRNIFDASARIAELDANFTNSKKVRVTVQCFPLLTYLLALNVTIIDYFSLDVEGSDFDILKTIPFDRVMFRVLEVEIRWIKAGRDKVKEFMESKGYKMVKYVAPVDFIFIHNSVTYENNWFNWVR